MKALALILKIVFAPVWVPLWVVWRLGKVLILAVVVAAATGCTTNTGHIDKSPCACTFAPFEVPAAKEDRNV